MQEQWTRWSWKRNFSNHGKLMTREEEIELIEAFSDGLSERYSTSALQRLRLAWSLASN
jgi:hypothetical protein